MKRDGRKTGLQAYSTGIKGVTEAFELWPCRKTPAVFVPFLAPTLTLFNSHEENTKLL